MRTMKSATPQPVISATEEHTQSADRAAIVSVNAQASLSGIEKAPLPNLQKINLLDVRSAVPLLLAQLENLGIARSAASSLRVACLPMLDGDSREISLSHIISSLWIKEQGLGRSVYELRQFDLDGGNEEARLHALKFLSLSATICSFANAPMAKELLQVLSGVNSSVFSGDEPNSALGKNMAESREIIEKLKSLEETRSKLETLIAESCSSQKSDTSKKMAEGGSAALFSNVKSEMAALETRLKQLEDETCLNNTPFSRVGFSGGMLLQHGYEFCATGAQRDKKFFAAMLPENLKEASVEQRALCEGFLSPYLQIRDGRSAASLKESDLCSFKTWSTSKYSKLNYSEILDRGVSPKALDKLFNDLLRKTVNFRRPIMGERKSDLRNLVEGVLAMVSGFFVSAAFHPETMGSVVAAISTWTISDCASLTVIKKRNEEGVNPDRDAEMKRNQKKFIIDAVLSCGLTLPYDLARFYWKKKSLSARLKNDPEFRLLWAKENNYTLPNELR